MQDTGMLTSTGALQSHNETNDECKAHVQRVNNLPGMLKNYQLQLYVNHPKKQSICDVTQAVCTATHVDCTTHKLETSQ
jgi:hypothetical protein